MHARTLYTNTRTRVFAGANWALAALAVLFMMSCAKSSVIEDTPNIDTNGKDPMKFTCLTDDSEQEHNTRADAQPLTTDFMVSTYKAYSLATQFPVMANYHVEYKTSGTAWDGTMRPYWDYTGVSGQYEKFWDYSAFPYRFHAIAPYPTNPANITLGDKSLSINAPYSYQTVHNGMVTPTDRVAEPYIVAQVQRNTDGRDYDHLATSADNKEINKSSQTRNRYVSLPFHHLNSKVRFGIYSTSPWTTDNPLYIKDMLITVDSPNFATSATGYQANPGSSPYSWYIGTGNSGFTNPGYATAPAQLQLLRFDGGKEISDNNLTLHQGKSSAYWLQCPDGIMQIPQEDVILHVSLKLYRKDNDSAPYKEFTDVPIRMEDGTYKYNWLSGYIHTYYLIIGDIEDKLELTFTATLTPWEDISGSLTTDLEK